MVCTIENGLGKRLSKDIPCLLDLGGYVIEHSEDGVIIPKMGADQLHIFLPSTRHY